MDIGYRASTLPVTYLYEAADSREECRRTSPPRTAHARGACARAVYELHADAHLALHTRLWTIFLFIQRYFCINIRQK